MQCCPLKQSTNTLSKLGNSKLYVLGGKKQQKTKKNPNFVRIPDDHQEKVKNALLSLNTKLVAHRWVKEF